MLLKTSPVENVPCACVADDCDAQGVSSCWVKGTRFLMLLQLWDLGLCKLNVVFIWSVSSCGAVDSPGMAAAATMASSSTTACLCPQQRQQKGTCSSSWTSSVWTYWAGLYWCWPTSTRQDGEVQWFSRKSCSFIPPCLLNAIFFVWSALISPKSWGWRGSVN